MTQIIYHLNGLEEAQQQMQRIVQKAGAMPVLMASVGEYLLNSVDDNFEQATAPDGTPWEKNSPATFARMLGKRDVTKKGKLNKRGANRVMGKSPLIMSRMLRRSIHYKAASTQVTVGSNSVYAAMMHFGGKKADFPHLWGDIPARNYLGIKALDKTIILKMTVAYFENLK